MNNSLSPVVLVGYSGHAFVVADALLSSKFKIAGYLEKEEKANNPYGLSYLGNDGDKDCLNGLKEYAFIVAIGDNLIRKKVQRALEAELLQITNVNHPSAIISPLITAGKGVMIFAGAVVNALAEIGNGVILNTNCTVEHECRLGDFVHIAPGAVLAGNVTVGDNSFIGANSVVKQGVSIGKNVIVGAGCVVLNDVPDNVTIVGNPGRIVAV
ncbi:acetyltransferase [Solitalea lacus]|uniref:acetyltransferase n=1 Tax=Solitalea lacus TaxID=2911172 RepID=UPI001EDA213B|nr:acetyltransferase [Solitalea lacus]UKJ08225.1 acetyltransferase [Solitalea lacus]